MCMRGSHKAHVKKEEKCLLYSGGMNCIIHTVTLSGPLSKTLKSQKQPSLSGVHTRAAHAQN